jgi:tetratricopeptide (TPR) repeat protein
MHTSVRRIVTLAVCLAVISLLAMPAMAQNRIIRGKVTNEKGEIVAGGEVTITGTDIKREYKVNTDKKGEYFYMGIPTGTYRVVIRAKGYQPDFSQGIRPVIGDNVFNFTLKPGDEKMKMPFDMSQAEIEKLKEDLKKAEKAKSMAGEVKVAFDAGLAAMAAGNYPEAITKFQEALAKDPEQAYIQANLGDALAKTNKNDEAVAAYQKAIGLKPDDAALYTNLGVLLGKMGKTVESQEMFKKAASLNPGAAAQNFYNLGATLVNDGKAAEAAEAFKQAIAADPNYAEAYYQLGLCMAGGPTTIPDAIKALQKYVQIGQKPDQVETAKAIIQSLQAKK